MKLIITENQLTKLIESFNINQNSIDELMRLIVSDNRLVPAYNKIYEQPDTVMDRRVGIEDRNMKALGLDPSKPSDRNIYLMKTYGKAVPEVMEEMRSFLFTDTGAAIQILAFLTGYGGLLVEAVWATMLLYDLFLLADGRGNYWNILIDLLCLLSGGILSKVVSGVSKGAAPSISQAIGKLIKTGLTKNPTISKILTNIKGYTQTVLQWFDDVAIKFGKLTPFSWMRGKIANFKTYITKLIDDIFKASPKAATIMTGKAILARNPAKSLSNYWNSLDPKITNVFSLEGVKTTTLKIIDGYIEKLRDTSIESVLDTIDKVYGTSYGNYFRVYLSGKKLNKLMSKRGNITSSDIVKDFTVSGGETFSPTQKYTKYIDTISKGGDKSVAASKKSKKVTT
jgi:hypothetical protein